MALIKTGSGRHSVRPTLLLDFANSKKLDNRVEFYRSTNATVFDGLATTITEENYFRYSQELTNAYWDYNRHSLTGGQTAPDGTSTAYKFTQYSTDGTAGYFGRLNWVFTPGTYTLSGYFKAGSDGGYVVWDERQVSTKRTFFNLTNGTVGTTDSSHTATIFDAGNGWYRCAITFTVTPNDSTTQMLFYFGNADNQTTSTIPANGESGFAWGLQYERRDTLTAYTPTTSKPITKYRRRMNTMAYNEPRFDHNPVTGESLGLLLEEQRTNRIPNSSMASVNGVNTTHESTVAPDGSYARVYRSNSSNAQHYVQQIWDHTSGATYAFSVFAKKMGTQNTFQHFASSSNFNGAWVRYDLENGTIDAVSSTGVIAADIEDVGDGWYRCWFTATAQATTSSPFYLGVYDLNSRVGSYQHGVAYWGVQVEQGNFPTSYIATSGSSVTRAAEQPVINDLGTNSPDTNWYQGGQGTAFCEGRVIACETSQGLFSFYNSTGGNDWLTMYSSGNNLATNQANYAVHFYSRDWYATGMPSSQSGLVDRETFVRGALSWNQDTVISAMNGSSNSATNETRLEDFDTLSFWKLYQNGFPGRGVYIKKFAYYPEALTAEELEELTEE